MILQVCGSGCKVTCGQVVYENKEYTGITPPPTSCKQYKNRFGYSSKQVKVYDVLHKVV